MISKFDQWKLRKGKVLPPTDARNLALKFIISETLKYTLDGAKLGAINLVKDDAVDITQEDINEMIQAFDKGWQKFYQEWGNSLDTEGDEKPEEPTPPRPQQRR